MFHESRVQTKQEQKGEETPVSVTVRWGGNKQRRREREMLDGFLYVY